MIAKICRKIRHFKFLLKNSSNVHGKHAFSNIQNGRIKSKVKYPERFLGTLLFTPVSGLKSWTV